MKFIVVLGLLAFASFASCKPCTNCYRLQEGSEEYGAAVFLFNKTLKALADTKVAPIFSLAKTNSIDVELNTAYPIVNALLEDQERKQQLCDVKIFKPLDAEDLTTEYKVEFDCEQYKATRDVIVKN